jgi:hypothetical protein
MAGTGSHARKGGLTADINTAYQVNDPTAAELAEIYASAYSKNLPEVHEHHFRCVQYRPDFEGLLAAEG